MVTAQEAIEKPVRDTTVVKGYRFVTQNMNSTHGDIEWEVGVWQVHEGEQAFCKAGLHFSRTSLDSLQYVCGNRWFEVEARGNILDRTDESNAQELRLMREIDVKYVVVRFAVACARRSLHYFEDKHPDDKRPRQAIEAAEEYVKDTTDSAADAARAAMAAEAAADAAWAARAAADAAWAAMAAAEVAEAAMAAEAAADAAWAARAAADAAWAAEAAADAAMAAWAAELKWQRETLDQIIAESFEKKEVEA